MGGRIDIETDDVPELLDKLERYKLMTLATDEFILENRRSHSSNPHRSQRRNRAPSGPRFRTLALLGRLSWERVDGFVMQASEKPPHEETFRLPN